MANYTNTNSYTLISGSAAADSIFNSGEYYVTISGGDGNDTIYGLNSDDILKITGATFSTIKSGSDLKINVGSGSITVKDGANSSPRIINIAGKEISNTGSRTLLSGTSESDSINNSGDTVTINAGAGNDTITNTGNRVSIDVGAGNDEIFNYGDSVTISGGAGNDEIFNDGNSVKIDAGAGDDTIYNSAGSVSSASGGSVSASGGASVAVSINGGAGNDLIYNWSRASNVTIFGGDGADTIENYGDYVSINGGAGNDSILVYGSSSSSSSSVASEGYYNTIYGGAGNDYISISSNARYTQIQYANGDGNDTIFGLNSDDTLKITGAEYTTAKSGANLIIGVGNGSILVSGGANTKFNIDGTLKAETTNNDLTGTAKADTLTNSVNNKLIDALAGNDSITNSGSNVTISGGKGNDTITNTGSKNIYKYANGDGKDTITGFNSNDTLQITSGTIKSSLVSGSDLIFNVGSGSITLKNMKVGATVNILNADNSTETLIVPAILQGTAKADTLTNSNNNYEIDALAGNDSITNSGSNVTISGGKGNDTITNNGSRNIYKYANGDGKDTITGFNSNDTLQITSGTIKSSLVSGSDLIFTVGAGSITLKDVVGTEINLLDEKSNASKIYVPYVHTLTTRADSFINEDDNYLIEGLGGNDSIDNFAENVTIDGGDGNDLIYNGGSAALIDGGKGNDAIDNFADNSTILGGKGNDTIYTESKGALIQYANGDGKDTVIGFSATDTLQITDGAIKNITAKGMNVIVNVGSGSITLEDSAGKNINVLDSSGKLTSTIYSGTWEGTAKADTFTNSADKLTLYARAGNDKITNYGSSVTIDGGNGHDKIYLEGGSGATVIGGKGNDTIYNNSGAARYQYARGDGKDVIYGFSRNDTLQITSGTVNSVTTSNGDTIVKVGTGSITLKNFSAAVNLVDSKNSAINLSTFDLFEDNNFISDENNLDTITETKYSVTEIQNTKDELNQMKTLLTFAKK